MRDVTKYLVPVVYLFPNIFLIPRACLCTIKCSSGTVLFKIILSWSRIFILKVGKNLLLIMLHLELRSCCFSEQEAFKRCQQDMNYFRWLLMDGAVWATRQSFVLISVASSASTGPPWGLCTSWHFSGPQFLQFLQRQEITLFLFEKHYLKTKHY